MTEFRYDEQSQQIVVTLAGNQPLDADELLANAERWLQQQKTDGALDGYQLHPRRIKQLLANRRDSEHLGTFNQGPLTFVAATTARHHGDIQLSPVEEGSPFAFKISITPLTYTRQQTPVGDGFSRFAANIADLAISQGYPLGNRSQLHAAYLQWQAGSLVCERPIGKPYNAEQRLGKRYRLFSHQVRPEIYLVIWDEGLLTDHLGLTKMISGTKQGVEKVNAVGARHYTFQENHLRKEIERAIHGPERLGVDLPLSILVAIDTSYSDAPILADQDPDLALPTAAPRHQPVKTKALTPKPNHDTNDGDDAIAMLKAKVNSPASRTADLPAKSHPMVHGRTEAQNLARMTQKRAENPPPKAARARPNEVVRIDGDLTVNYGRDLIRGSMHVTGSIENGVALAVTGDLIVDGAIGNATLKIGGNLVVKQAIVTGQDNGISVEGHLSANAIANSRLFVHGNIIVATSIIHSQIEFCRNLIIKDLGHGLLAGGMTKVRDTMICGNIGFPKGETTDLHIGVADLPIMKDIEQLESRQAELTSLRQEWQTAQQEAKGDKKGEARAQLRISRIDDMLATVADKLRARHQQLAASPKPKEDFGKAHLMVAATLWDNVALYLAGKGYKLPRAVQRVQIAANIRPPVKKLDFDALKQAYLAITAKR